MAAEPDFKLGDVVATLGGPSMTIDMIAGDFVYCVWFTAEGDRLRDHFKRRDLHLAPRQPA